MERVLANLVFPWGICVELLNCVLCWAITKMHNYWCSPSEIEKVDVKQTYCMHSVMRSVYYDHMHNVVGISKY